MKIIGLAGTNGSGKDTVAEILSREYGYYSVSATDMLEAELKLRGLSSERENKRSVGNEWRERYGLSYIVDKAIELAEKAGANKLTVGSLRHPAEAKKVKHDGGIVLWVDADQKLRYERVQSGNRGRIEDKKTYKQFQREESEELNKSSIKAGLSGAEVKKYCDVFIENDGTEEELKKQIATKLGRHLS